jgi:hypothetical protein
VRTLRAERVRSAATPPVGSAPRLCVRRCCTAGRAARIIRANPFKLVAAVAPSHRVRRRAGCRLNQLPGYAAVAEALGRGALGDGSPGVAHRRQCSLRRRRRSASHADGSRVGTASGVAPRSAVRRAVVDSDGNDRAAARATERAARAGNDFPPSLFLFLSPSPPLSSLPHRRIHTRTHTHACALCYMPPRMCLIDAQRLFAGGIFTLRRLQEHDTVHAKCIGALSQLRALLGLPEGQASVKPGGARVVSEVAQLVAEVHVQPGSLPAFTQRTHTQALMAVQRCAPALRARVRAFVISRSWRTSWLPIVACRPPIKPPPPPPPPRTPPRSSGSS